MHLQGLNFRSKKTIFSAKAASLATQHFDVDAGTHAPKEIIIQLFAQQKRQRSKIDQRHRPCC